MNCRKLVHTLASHGAIGVLTLVALGFQTSSADAQVVDVEAPYVVVVDAQRAPIRCGADELYYEVCEVKQGTMLLVDGSDAYGVSGDGWLRVAYPDDQPALVKAIPDHLDVSEMRGTVTLLRPSRLIALSIDGELSQSWKKLLAKPLEPGASLRIIETIRDDNGEPLAYLVPSPDSARGFMHGRHVRQATASETQAYFDGRRAADDAPVADAAEEPVTQITRTTEAPSESTDETIADASPAQVDETPTQTAQATTKQSEPQESTTTVAEGDQRKASGGDVGSLLGVGAERADANENDTNAEPQAREQTHATPRAPVMPPQQLDSTVAIADDETFEAAEPARPSRQPGAQADATPSMENRPLPTMSDLESAYTAVLAQKASDAEVGPLIREHERYLEAMQRGEASGDDLDREVLRAHLELLKIRADLQRSMLRIQNVREQAQQGIRRIDEGIEGIDRSSEYLVVGRLTTSVVYDGKRLPLLYRVQSVDDESARTLAYIVPMQGVDLAGSLGTIVGVAGSSRVDPSSRLNIITPDRVDRLSAPSTASAQ